MTVTTRTFDYEIDGAVYEGFHATPIGDSARAVMLCHAWAGRGTYENHYAEKIAEWGFTVMAIDLYGKGKRGQTTEECQALMTPFVEDRAMLRDRLFANIDVAKSLDGVDANRVAVAGFCFGGLCAFDVARGNGAVRSATGFHSLFMPNGLAQTDPVKPKVLALHGWDDPMAKPDDVLAFSEEMTNRQADWQLHAFGGTMHAFTNPDANDPDFGTVYNQTASDRSWAIFNAFLQETL